MKRIDQIFDVRGVAPLAGSVDRNSIRDGMPSAMPCVAPLAGSVDRNIVSGLREVAAAASLPSRGAWIEIWRRRPSASRRPRRSPRGERG